MTIENIVEISKLAFAYPTREIFKDVNLAIPRGQVTGIMGGSGSGKSTLLRLIGGQLQPTGGTCKVMGQDVHQLGHDALYELRRKIGIFPRGAPGDRAANKAATYDNEVVGTRHVLLSWRRRMEPRRKCCNLVAGARALDVLGWRVTTSVMGTR